MSYTPGVMSGSSMTIPPGVGKSPFGPGSIITYTGPRPPIMPTFIDTTERIDKLINELTKYIDKPTGDTIKIKLNEYLYSNDSDEKELAGELLDLLDIERSNPFLDALSSIPTKEEST